MQLAAIQAAPGAPPTLPDTVHFPSADGHTTLTGYVFKPQTPSATPAMVMMHGRSGAYSSLARDEFTAATLSKRHLEWGRLWAAQGYLAILVDGFGPRGYPAGFPAHSYDQRPDSLNEVTVRPLDAYGTLAYLRKRIDVMPDRIAIQGWSNGGSATLATMADDAPGLAGFGAAAGFRGGLAFYPACGLKDHYPDGIATYAPVRVYQGSADEEVSPRRCQRLVARSRTRGSDIAYTLYPGATHDFDDPGRRRQSAPANVAAKADATLQATAFLAAVFKR